MSRNLTAADWLSVTLPAEAIAVIRRMRVPLPAALLRAHSSPRLQRDWEVSTKQHLTEVIQHAIRPVHSSVDANAEAVIFADRAELLASLATDWRRGQLNTCWWWRALLGTVDLRAAARQAWLEAPEYVPAALAQLAVKGEAAAFAQMLGREDARALRQAVTACFALPAIERCLSEWEAASVAAPELSLAPAFWNPYAPECAAVELNCAAQTLLGISLLLTRAPAVIRAPQFAQRLQAELRGLRRAMIDPAGLLNRQASARPTPFSEPITPPQEVTEPTAPDTPAVPIRQSAVSPTPSALSFVESAPESRARQREYDAAAMLPARPASSVAEAEARPITVSPTEVWLHAPPETLSAVASARAEQFPLPLAAREVETAFGGVFYLVNLALLLGFYGDFTTPQQPGLAALGLPIWDFIALVGRALTGEELLTDPVWELLAQLAGRAADDEPGATFTPPAEWPVTEDWRAWLCGTLRTRLQAALGSAAPRPLGQLVCRARARVGVTATHLEVTFSLTELPIEIRLAGFDRDPGWVPAAGRYVAFHFD